MNRAGDGRSGFTLIELLTVIAIIGILAALTATVLPRALERAKIASLENTFHQMRTILVDYFADHASYPPAYGYIGNEEKMFAAPEDIVVSDFMLEPYMVLLKSFDIVDLYDPFSASTDSDRDDEISSLEFSPMGQKRGVDSHEFVLNAVYNVPDAGESIGNSVQLNVEVRQQLEADKRPLIYIPVNARQAKKVSDFWFEKADAEGNNNGRYDDDDPRPKDLSIFVDMRFPPPKYDAYVLISVGPEENTRGLLLPEVPAGFGGVYHYHVLGLMAYFMATRDADGNDKLDFDFLARTRESEGENPNNRLPDPEAPNAAGPVIRAFP